MRTTRRSLLLAAATLPALAACSGGSDTGSADGGAAGGSGASDAGGTTTIEHIYGTTEIQGTPQRIATLSWVNADTLLALGVVPVAMPAVEWGGNANTSTDWIDAKLGELGAEWGSDTAPAQYSEADGVNFDEIAANTPDLIIGAYSGLTPEDYDKLSQIAPTIGPLAPDYTAAWDDVLLTIGTAVGKQDEATALRDELTRSLAAAGEENPAVAASSFIAGNLDLPTGALTLYTAGDTRSRFFSALGMSLADVVTKNTADEKTFSLEWSPERADELDADVFYSWAAAGATVESFQQHPMFGQIPAVKKGALVLTADDHTTLAISALNALSIPWAIENIVPDVVSAAQTAQA
ncbi:ABC transporter substrate-binding protein [Brachybacterium sp. EF45031]|uniref:ABC transporter substrate-binding protein n=1 Tax=Brachybacterium sillae TaxID=2810536 RepID=UPI00217D60D9|nr:ABC transporter substrate-binding protein [Brachybacterium sillae]MCS6712111.1 ABC transporter substrate-binding protein [Brachybacterium sillae]